MKNNSLLYILLIFLVVANGFFLFNYMGNNNDKKLKGPPSPGNFIVKELGFDKEQLKEFRENNGNHHEAMMRLSEDIKNLKDGLFERVYDSTVNDKEVDSITTLIGLKQKEKEKVVFTHFKRIQDICNDKQKKKFKKIINDALHRGGGRNEGLPHPDGADEKRPPRREGPDGKRLPPPPHME